MKRLWLLTLLLSLLVVLGGCYKHGVPIHAPSLPTAASTCGDGFAPPPGESGSYDVIVHAPNKPPKLGSLPIPAYAGDFLVQPTAASPFAIRDGSSVVRDTFETAHGKITAGGGGTDFIAAMGPDPGFEGVASNLWLVPNGTALTLSNFAIQGQSASTTFNAPSLLAFDLANVQQFAVSSGALGLNMASVQWANNVAAPTLTQLAATGAAQPLAVTAQAAGGTNDGGQLVFGGGAHAGTGTVDGSVKITTPLNGGLLSFAPAAGANNLTNAQSDVNFVLMTGTNVGTITFARRIADTSCVWLKNATSQTQTISYLTGGTVTMLTNTSALVCSDGANLQKIMTGT